MSEGLGITTKDINLLLEAIDIWQAWNTQDYNVLNLLKTMPLPPEGSSEYEVLSQLKERALSRQQEIENRHRLVEEQAVSLRYKLILARRALEAKKVLEMSLEELDDCLSQQKQSQGELTPESKQIGQYESCRRSLQLAEQFIRDVGIWHYYEKFLLEQATESQEDASTD